MGITTTWKPSPYFSANYGDSTNWYAGVSGLSDTAEFEASSVTNISVTDDERAGQWLFNPGATQYNSILLIAAQWPSMESALQ